MFYVKIRCSEVNTRIVGVGRYTKKSLLTGVANRLIYICKYTYTN